MRNDRVTSRQFASTASGPIHVATCGEGLPVILLHQTPRSWDEYRDVLPILGAKVWAIAPDTPGFGASPQFVDRTPTIEEWAATMLSLLDTLHIQAACVVGHHTGACTAMEMAAQAPDRVAALVLSSCPMVDAERRRSHATKTPVDTAECHADGRHLLQLWRQRQPLYPPGDTDLLNRFLVDALRAGDMAVGGHQVVNAYKMEERIGRVIAPTLVIGAVDDPHAYPSAARVCQGLKQAWSVDIPGGMVPLPDQKPAEFADAILSFLRQRHLVA